jgi:hypothetical protein
MRDCATRRPGDRYPGPRGPVIERLRTKSAFYGDVAAYYTIRAGGLAVRRSETVPGGRTKR